MRFEIHCEGRRFSPALVARVERRLWSAFGPIASRVGSIRVYLDAPAEPDRPGAACRVVVRVPRLGKVVVLGRGERLVPLISGVVRRAAAATRRRLSRRRALRRRPRNGRPLTTA